MAKYLGHFLGVVVCLLAVGCGREEAQTYRVPKEQAPAVMPPDHHQHALAPAAAKPLKWQTPAGWEELPASQMRVGSFRITGADGLKAEASIIPLPDRAGGELGNVNRWRGQVGLEPVTAAELKKSAEPVTLAGQPTALYDLAGTQTRILAAMQPRQGTTWFFKMTGDTKLVGEQKPAFVEFLKSVVFN